MIERLLPGVWRLIRSGFVTRWEREGGSSPEGTVSHVLPIADVDRAETIAYEVFAAPITQRAVLERLREKMISNAVTATQGAARELGLIDLDRVIAGEAELEVPEGQMITPELDVEGGRPVALAAIEALGPQVKRTMELRFLEGKSELEAAAALGVGRALVRSRERRIRHHARHALRMKLHQHLGQAALDHLISSTAVPPITMQRLQKRIASRIQPVEPAPYAVRARWAVGTAVLAAIAFVLFTVAQG